MRVKKASVNVIVNFITYLLGFMPIFFVRRVFLMELGEAILGLNSLYTNIIGLLSIVELGIGTAIIFALYKPFAEDDKVKIKGYLDYYLKFYRTAGFIILTLGIAIIPFLKYFVKGQVGYLEVSICFIIFLLNTFLSYMFSGKICMLYVSQEGYKVSVLNTIAKVIIALLQIVFLKIYASFAVYLIIQLLVNAIYYLVINIYISKMYPWIKNTNGKLEKEEKASLSKNIKALFLHKVGGLAVLSTDNLIVSAFLSLDVLSKIGSYNMVITSAQNVIVSTLSGITASVGNLLTEDDNENSYIIHKRIFFLNFWIASFVVISIYNSINQFVVVWLNDSQLIDGLTLAILLINLYFVLMRSSVEAFKEAGGIYYQDRYSPIFEGVINLISSIVLVNLIGLPGVFLGTLISNFTVVFWVKPKVTYKYIFNKPLINYFKIYGKYSAIALIPLLITQIITNSIKSNYTISAFIINCMINMVVINGIYLIIFRKNKEFLYFKEIIFNMIKSKWKFK